MQRTNRRMLLYLLYCTRSAGFSRVPYRPTLRDGGQVGGAGGQDVKTFRAMRLLEVSFLFHSQLTRQLSSF